MPAARPWWRSPTVIVVAGCLIAIITFGVRTTFGLFTAPLADLRGWDREAFALAIAVQNLVWGLGQPPSCASSVPQAVCAKRRTGPSGTRWRSPHCMS
jgi:hypothetical protein